MSITGDPWLKGSHVSSVENGYNLIPKFLVLPCKLALGREANLSR